MTEPAANRNTHYYVSDAEGNITTTGVCAVANISTLKLPAGETAAAGDASAQGQYLDISSGELRAYTADQVQARDAFPGRGWRWSVAAMAWVDVLAEAARLATAKGAALDAINAGFDSAAAALTAGYPVAEQSTWDAQRTEALAWSVDSTTATPFLDNVAAARGIDRADMLAKTLENVQQFLTVSALLVGRRQALRDAIAAATIPAAVAAIVWSLP